MSKNNTTSSEVGGHVHRFEFEEWSYDQNRRVLICECGATKPAPESDEISSSEKVD